MAYAVKYRITQASQSETTGTVDILEDGYAGSVINYDATFLNMQYIPRSDDPYETIYASQLSVGINVTDDADNMPDFTAMNDRKYLVKYYKGADLAWQGWALSDNVQYIFRTGFKELSFNAICGLGMIDRIDFSITLSTYRITILSALTECLKVLLYPTAPNILVQCSIYSSVMTNRATDGKAEPFSQSYMAVNNFIVPQIDDTGIVRNEFSCLDVLSDIMQSWGCRIFMANGEWNIVQLNQACEATRYYTRYDGDGVYVDHGTFAGNVNITSGGSAIFVGGDQLKIYKKGFNNFIGFKEIKFPENMIFNPELKLRTGDDADFWTETVGGTGYVAIKANQEKGVNAWIMTLGNTTTGALAQVDNNTPIPIQQGDAPKLQFRLYNTTFNLNVGGQLLPHCLISLKLNTGTVTYYLTEDNEWVVFTIGADAYYQVNDKTNNSLVNLEEIPPVPASGELYFGIIIKGSGVNTQQAIIIGDFEITIASEFKSVLMTAKLNDTNSYRKEVVFPHGYNIDNIFSSVKPSYLGAITDTNGNQMSGWYMMERYTTESFFSLANLMFNNYVNMLRKNIINIDATIKGSFSALNVLTFTDSDPAQISVQGTKYMIGNTSFDTQRNECSGTYLQLDNTDQDVSITTIYDNGVGDGIGFNMHQNGATTSAAACLFNTYTLTKYSTQFLPVIGDFIYNDVNLSFPFAGNGIWWKFFIPYYNTTRSYKILVTGEIIDVSTC